MRVGRAVIEFVLKHFKYDERYIVLFTILVQHLDEEVSAQVIAQEEKAIGELLTRKMASIASSSSCSHQGKQCIKDVIMRQCVICDRGYYENTLIS